jgi:hypothetical protein
MQDIRQAIRRKQAQQAQLAKEIDLLHQAEEKLREIAPLLADNEEDEENAVLAEVDEEIGQPASPATKSAAASAGSPASADQPESGKTARPLALRWP